jgi:outer membrane translocation and assembly module TamA
MCSLAAGISGGLNLFQGLAMQSAAKDAANQTYNQEVEGVKSAEDNKRNKQLALAEQKQAKKAQEAQNVFAKNIESLQATATLLSTGRVGNTINLLVMDQARQAGNYRESVRQTLESFARQYDRNIQSTESEYQGIRNRLRSRTINAYNQIPSTGSILLGAATSAFNTELGMGEDSFFRR